jgi:hypothetical protein
MSEPLTYSSPRADAPIPVAEVGVGPGVGEVGPVQIGERGELERMQEDVAVGF